MPIIPSYSPLPAGIAKMKIVPFITYTLVGAFIWSYALALIGVRLGENWESIKTVGHKFDYIIIALIIIAVVWYIKRHIKNSRKMV